METMFEKTVKERAEKLAGILSILDEHPRTTVEINGLLGTLYTPLEIGAFLRDVEGVERHKPPESGKCWTAYSYAAPPKTEAARQAARRSQIKSIEGEVDRLIALVYQWGGSVELCRTAKYVRAGTKILPGRRTGKEINSLKFLTD